MPKDHNGPDMETCHESTYRCSRIGRADRGSYVLCDRERCPGVPGELGIRLQRLLTADAVTNRRSERAQIAAFACKRPAEPAARRGLHIQIRAARAAQAKFRTIKVCPKDFARIR